MRSKIISAFALLLFLAGGHLLLTLACVYFLEILNANSLGKQPQFGYAVRETEKIYKSYYESFLEFAGENEDAQVQK